MTAARVARDSLTVFARLLVSGGIMVATNAVLAKALHPSGFGVFSLVVVTVTMAYTLASFGLASSVVVMIGRSRHSLDEIVAKQLGYSLLLSAFLMTVVAGSYYAEVWPDLPISTPFTLSAFLLAVPLMTIHSNLLGVLHGLGNFRGHGIASIAPGAISLTLYIAVLPHFDAKYEVACLMWILGLLGGCVLLIRLLWENIRNAYKNFNRRSDFLRESMRFGIVAHAGNLIGFINYKIALYFLAGLKTSDQVGLYAAATPIADALLLVSTAAGTVVFARLAATVSLDAGAKTVTTALCRMVVALTLAAGLALYVIAPTIVFYLYGSSFDETASIIRALIPAVILWAVVRLLSSDLAGRGRPDLNLYMAILNFLVLLVATPFLVSDHGAIGAAIATNAAYLVTAIATSVIYSRETRASALDFWVIRMDDLRAMVRLARPRRSG